jgi:hypothetical protein
MTTQKSATKTIVVAGDVTIDWNLARVARLEGSSAGWNAEDQVQTHQQHGGAALLADLLTVVAESGTPKIEVRHLSAPPEVIHPSHRQYHHSYAMWSPFPVAGKAKDRVWRVEKFLGLDRSESFPQPTESELKNIAAAFGAADLLVLDDANLGFRKEGQIWSTGFTSEAPSSWILLKMSRPIAEGKLWEHLYQQFAERLIVVMTVADLRGSEVQISRALSWEKTAEDLARELVQNPRVNALARCAHVVISFGTAGAFWLQNTAAANHKLEVECQLLFDPAAMEGTWEQGYPGKMIGYTSCLAAGIARQLMLQPKAPQLASGITSGLSALRKLHHIGYGECGEGKVITPLAFPLKAIAEELAAPQTSFVVTTIPARFCAATSAREKCATNAWTILALRAEATKKPLFEIARHIVLDGVEATLHDVPLGRFGGLLTLDRQEMESYRSIGALIREYRRQTNLDRPLSLAVFGAPGSGKSFGIVQVVKSIFHDDLKKLTFTAVLLRVFRCFAVGQVCNLPQACSGGNAAGYKPALRAGAT